MSTDNNDYSAPSVSEYNLDPGGNYVSPASGVDDTGPGVLGASGDPI